MRLVVCGCALGAIFTLQGCGGGGSSGGGDKSTSTLTTTTSTTTTGKPHTPWTPECSAHPECARNASKQGMCCPSADAVFDECCGQVSTSASMKPFVGMGYGAQPVKIRINPHCDDFMATWSEPLWGSPGRDDLKVMKDLGVTVVRTYGIGSHLDHKGFLDHAHELGLKVMPGFADYPYLGEYEGLRSAAGIQTTPSTYCNMGAPIHSNLPANCVMGNNYDCHDAIKAHYSAMLQNGYTIVDDDGKRRYHPAVYAITIANEMDLKLSYHGGGALGQEGRHAKVVVSALDGLLSAEDELDIEGHKPLLTATASYAKCVFCKSVKANFPDLIGRKGPMPYLAFAADYFLGVQDPQGFLGYSAKHDLMEVYQTRWVNSFNTARPANSLCQVEDQVLSAYTRSPLGAIPVYIGEFHSVEHPAVVATFQGEVTTMKDITLDTEASCGPNPLKGFNIFEYQVSYWKGATQEGGTALKYGLFGLGETSIGKTKPDADSIGSEAADVFDVWCVFPAAMGGVHPTPGAPTWAGLTAAALNGKLPESPTLCSTSDFTVKRNITVV